MPPRGQERGGATCSPTTRSCCTWAGARSKGRRPSCRARNTALLLARHPHYERMVHDYIAADPLAPLRDAAQSELARSTGPAHGVLHVIHDHGGGTETHVRALIDASRDRWRHFLAIAVGDRWQIEEHRSDGRVVTYALTRETGESWRQFLRGICGTFAIALVHLHNISACREGLLISMPELGVPYGYTVHDLNFACPTITFLGVDGMFCGGQTDAAVCGRCLDAQPAFAGVDIAGWRASHGALLERAAFLIAPSRWAAEMLARYFPGRDVHRIAHGMPDTEPASSPTLSTVALPDDDVAAIAVLGAIGPDKGARRVERLVALARGRALALRFVVIGYLDVQHAPWRSDDARFVVHGRYDPRDLAALLDRYRVALVLYPSAGPETFSYTLSEAWAAGRPALVPPIGALPERLAATGAGWVMTDAQWRDEARMLDRIVELLGEEAADELAAAGERARRAPHATLREMAEATFARYEGALDRTRDPRALPSLDRARVRDALGYRAVDAAVDRRKLRRRRLRLRWSPAWARVSRTLRWRSAPRPLGARCIASRRARC